MAILQKFFLYGIGLLAFFVIGYALAAFELRDVIKAKKKEALNLSRNVLKGKISEQIAPYLPNFPKDLKASEARFIGDPIDFVIFKGMDDKNISEIVFVEVKSGRKYSNSNENSLKEAVVNKRVRYEAFHVAPEMFKQEMTDHPGSYRDNPKPQSII